MPRAERLTECTIPLCAGRLGSSFQYGTGRSDLRWSRRGMYGMLLFVVLAIFIAGLIGGANTGILRKENFGHGCEAGVHRSAGARILGTVFTAWPLFPNGEWRR